MVVDISELLRLLVVWQGGGGGGMVWLMLLEVGSGLDLPLDVCFRAERSRDICLR